MLLAHWINERTKYILLKHSYQCHANKEAKSYKALTKQPYVYITDSIILKLDFWNECYFCGNQGGGLGMLAMSSIKMNGVKSSMPPLPLDFTTFYGPNGKHFHSVTMKLWARILRFAGQPATMHVIRPYTNTGFLNWRMVLITPPGDVVWRLLWSYFVCMWFRGYCDSLFTNSSFSPSTLM